ncbi:MAG: hypothetical protein RR579_05655 [Eubacterium sp.]
MLQQMSKIGKLFFFISLISLFFIGYRTYDALIGGNLKNYSDILFIYYTIQVIIGIVMVGTHLIHDWFQSADIKPVLTLVYINIIIYCVLSICFGYFYTYIVDMFGLIADVLNGVFLVCIIFWYKQMMG